MKRVYNKLVRDKIPEIIKNNGETPTTRTLDGFEFKKCLLEKLKEEYEEVLRVGSDDELIEELADMLEIIYSISTFLGKDVTKIMKDKRKKRGGFDKKIFLIDVEEV